MRECAMLCSAVDTAGVYGQSVLSIAAYVNPLRARLPVLLDVMYEHRSRRLSEPPPIAARADKEPTLFIHN